jgi:hypothetical protein
MKKEDLEPAKKILRNFISELDKLKECMSAPMQATAFSIKDRIPEFHHDVHNPDPYWEKENAYRWIFAETGHYRRFFILPP